MRDILALCVELDTAAVETYERLAAACDDSEMSGLFAKMGKEEESHVEWWTDLLQAWESGLVPPVSDEQELLSSLQALAVDVRSAVPSEYADLSVDQMLSVAAHMEFYMLDTAFAELLDQVLPSRHVDVREAYTRHIMRLVEAIESRHDRTNLSHFLARALSRALRDQQRLSRLATQDPLTGLYNRRGFFSYVQHWVAYATRYAHPLSVLLVDVDRFKTINDRFGHPAGDEALKTVAAALRRGIRDSDIVGRYGGDEFAILAPETDRDDLEALMQRVLEAIRDTKLDPAGHGLTVSMGGSFVSDGVPVTSEQMLAAADQALYEAKAKGRDRAAPPRSAVGV